MQTMLDPPDSRRISAVICNDLLGKDPHRQIGVNMAIAPESLHASSGMVRTVSSTLGAMFAIFWELLRAKVGLLVQRPMHGNDDRNPTYRLSSR